MEVSGYEVSVLIVPLESKKPILLSVTDRRAATEDL
jgi:hypothetical protein